MRPHSAHRRWRQGTLPPPFLSSAALPGEGHIRNVQDTGRARPWPGHSPDPPGSTAPLLEFPARPPVSQANARPGHRSRWQIKQTYSRPQAGVQWWDPILSWPGCCVNQDGAAKQGGRPSPRTEEERWGSARPALQQAPLLSRGAGKGSSGPVPGFQKLQLPSGQNLSFLLFVLNLPCLLGHSKRTQGKAAVTPSPLGMN